MTKEELIAKIRKGADIMFTVNGRGFTICDIEMDKADNAKSIAEWYSDHIYDYPDAATLVQTFTIGGKTLGDLSDIITITDYTENGRE